MAAAGEPPERASVLCGLQACISEPARIIRHSTRDIVRRLVLLFTNAGRARGTGEEAKVSETEEIKSPRAAAASAEDEDGCNQQQADDDSNDWYKNIDRPPECEIIDEDHDSDSDSDGDDDGIDRGSSPPSTTIRYEGDNENIRKAYCLSRYLVELLAVRPRFDPFMGTFTATGPNMVSLYHSASTWQRGRNLDSWGNLVLHAEGRAIEDHFHIQVNIPKDDDELSLRDFVVDPYACNRVITDTISTKRGRKIDVTFVAMHKAIQADVRVTLVDLVSGATSVAACVYGEIAVHHQLFGDERVVLFSRREYDKAEVADDGEVPLSRKWVAVPIYLEPLLVIKLNLRVSTSRDGEGEGRTISFRGDLTFYRDEYEKVVRSGDHGKVIKVKISYPWY